MRFSFLVAFVAFVTGAWSQSQDSLSTSVLTPGSIIKLSPMHLANFYPTVEVSYEQALVKKFALQVEGGYVLNYKTNTDSDFQNKRGMKGKLEGRYYFSSNLRHTIYYYTAIEAYINTIRFDRSSVRTDCFDTNCTTMYTQKYASVVNYHEHGVSFKFGLQWMIRKFSIDINSGWTIRSIRYSHPDFPGQQLTLTGANIFQIPNETTRVTLGPNLGIRFGYRIR